MHGGQRGVGRCVQVHPLLKDGSASVQYLDQGRVGRLPDRGQMTAPVLLPGFTALRAGHGNSVHLTGADPRVHRDPVGEAGSKAAAQPGEGLVHLQGVTEHVVHHSGGRPLSLDKALATARSI